MRIYKFLFLSGLSILVLFSCINQSKSGKVRQEQGTYQQVQPTAKVFSLKCNRGYSVIADYTNADVTNEGQNRIYITIKTGKKVQEKIELFADRKAASGAKYTSMDGKTSFWEHKGVFTYIINDTTLCQCQKPVKTRMFTTKTGKTFTITEDHTGSASIGAVKVELKGFKHNTAINFGEIEPIKDIFLADVDNDGFEELYICTQSAGSGSYARFYGLVSVKDNEVVKLNFNINKEIEESKSYRGYQGHDAFVFESGLILHKFDVYKTGDKNMQPTGGTMRVYYKLVNEYGNWTLKKIP
jgi:hypothetical protein